MPIRLHSAAVSVAGEYRRVNQDAAFVASWGAGVADGVGGGPSGDFASAALVHRLVPGGMPPLDSASVAERVRLANWDLRAHAEHDPALHGMATTFTGLFVGVGERLLLAHTGDSRAYLRRSGVMTQQTRDDSFVQVLVDTGHLTVGEAAVHPRRNVIMASLSGRENDVVHVAEHPAIPGDRWLLCSDGLTDYAPASSVAGILDSPAAPDAVARALVELALAAGTRDNVTAVICDVRYASAHRREPATFAGAATQRFGEQLDATG